ncbi:Ion channel [Branchiostoma belcheri]|nr:Ion channel [Branchiostoma belcheri]
MRSLKLFGLVLAFVVYVLVGGVAFHFLENAEEEKMRKEVFKMNKDVDDMKRNTTEGMENACGVRPTPTRTPTLPNRKSTGSNSKKERDDACAIEGATCISVQSLPNMLSRIVNRLEAKLSYLTAGDKDCILDDDLPVLIMSRREFERHIREAYRASLHGLDPMSKDDNYEDSSPPMWSFSSAVGFSLTVVTTIGYGHIAPSTGTDTSLLPRVRTHRSFHGYGHIAPSTDGGRAFCVVYALVGIPLYLVILDGVGRLLGRTVRSVANKAHASRNWSVNDQDQTAITMVTTDCRVRFCTTQSDSTTRVQRLAWAATFGVGLCLFYLLPAAVVSLAESWSYPESLYYMFISLSTIGFGDYVAGKQRGRQYWQAYKALVLIWIACGLVFLAMVFDLMKRGIETIDSKDRTDRKDMKDTSGTPCEDQGMVSTEALVLDEKGRDTQKRGQVRPTSLV